MTPLPTVYIYIYIHILSFFCDYLRVCKYLPQAQVFSSRTRAMCFPCQVRWALRVRKRFQESSHFQPFDTSMTHIFSTGKDSNSYTQIQITVQNSYIHKFEQDQQGPIINKCILLDNKIIERWKPPDRLNASPDRRISFFRGRDAILEQLDKDPIIAHTNKDNKDMRHWKIAKLLVSLIGGMGDTTYIYIYSYPITQLFFCNHPETTIEHWFTLRHEFYVWFMVSCCCLTQHITQQTA